MTDTTATLITARLASVQEIPSECSTTTGLLNIIWPCQSLAGVVLFIPMYLDGEKSVQTREIGHADDNDAQDFHNSNGKAAVARLGYNFRQPFSLE